MVRQHPFVVQKLRHSTANATHLTVCVATLWPTGCTLVVITETLDTDVNELQALRELPGPKDGRT